MRQTRRFLFAAMIFFIVAAAYLLWSAARHRRQPSSVMASLTSGAGRIIRVGDKLYQLRAGALSSLPISADASAADGKTVEISPNQKLIAYIGSHELFLYDVVSGSVRQVTQSYRPATDKYLAVEVALQGWSHDGSRILFSIDPGVEECDDCEPRKVQQVAYGYYAYRIVTGQTEKVQLSRDFSFRAWLPSGRFIGVADVPCGGDLSGKCKGLAITDVNGSAVHALQYFNGDHRELSVSSDGRFAVTTLPFLLHEDRTNQSQIMKIDLTSEHGEMLTDLANEGQWRHPRFSPSGRTIAWTFYDQKSDRLGYLYVDSRNDVYRCEDLVDYDWQDDNHLLGSAATH